MRLGTTPIHTYTLPFDASLLKVFKVTYKQKDKIVLEKYLKDFTVNGNILTIKLTQEETFLFERGVNVSVQARCLTTGNDALSSDITYVSAGECLDNEVLK